MVIFGKSFLPVDLDVGIGLVVFSGHCNGVMALDQLVLEDQRLQLGVGDDPLQIGDLADETRRARMDAPAGLK